MKTELNDSKSKVVSPHEITYVVGRPVRNALVIMFAILLLPFTLVSIDVPEFFHAMLFADVLVYLMFAFAFNYFGVSKDFFEVRRYYLPGWRKQYPISFIDKVRIEWGGKGGYLLRIILLDGKTKRYPSFPFRDKDWAALIKLLKGAGVSVDTQGDFSGYDV